MASTPGVGSLGVRLVTSSSRRMARDAAAARSCPGTNIIARRNDESRSGF